MCRFVLITRSIFYFTTCAIPLCKALTDDFILTITSKTSDQVMGTLWPKNWKFHHYNGVVMSRFVLITRSIFYLTKCAIPLCKALTDGFISTMTPKTSDQVMGTLWHKNWKFHHYNGVAMSRFVLITRSNLTTFAIPLCKALTDGFISLLTPKTSDQVMGTDPKTENFIITMVLRCSFCPHNRSIFDLTICAIPLCKALTDGFISSIDT